VRAFLDARTFPSFERTRISERGGGRCPTGAVAKNLPGYNRDDRLSDVGAAASWEIDPFGGLPARPIASTQAAADKTGIPEPRSVGSNTSALFFPARLQPLSKTDGSSNCTQVSSSIFLRRD